MNPFARPALAGLIGLVAVLGVSCSEDEPNPIESDPTGSVRATVTGDGAALAGVTVRLFASGGATALTSATTAANGQVTFADRDVGTYDVEVVVLAGYELAAGEAARKPVTVAENQTATVTFALEEIVIAPTEGQIRARVVDGPNGVQGVKVRLFDAGGVSPLDSLTTASDGRVLFTSLTPGNYDVEITLPEDFEVVPGDTSRKEVSVTAGVTTDVQFGIDGPDPVFVDIMVANTAFSDADVTIAPGTTVRWIWVNGAHTVTPDGHAEWTDADLDSPGDTLLHTFNTIGEFAYFCQPHLAFGMTGIIRVE